MHPHHYKYYRLLVAASAVMILVIISLVTLLALQIDPFRRKAPVYLRAEEAVIVPETAAVSEVISQEAVIVPVEKVLFEYVEVTDGCGPYFEGICLNARSGPGEEFSSVAKLRNGIVLKVGGKVDRDGKVWYKIVFDEKLRYPERVTTDWYVSADYVKILLDEGTRNLKDASGSLSAKRIVVSRTEQMLYAYDGDELFMKEPISSGIEFTPTPVGTFRIYRKTPSRYMQGPIEGLTEQLYDLPGVPWDLYFSRDGDVIHGTYWHTNFGRRSSNGCVNLPPEQAKKLYLWAEIGTPVTVKD